MSLEKSFKNKNVLITGAGSGIGRALSLRLYSYGAKIYAVSLTNTPLDSLIKECPNIIPIQLDIAQSWDETRKVIDGIKDFVVYTTVPIFFIPRRRGCEQQFKPPPSQIG